MVSAVEMINKIIRDDIPSVQFIPAAFDAMIVAKGFVNDDNEPSCVQPNITATGTSRS